VAWDLNSTQRELASGLSQPNPFVWLFEVVVPSSPATMLRLAANTSHVNFGVNSNGDAIRYERAAFTVSVLSETSDGKLPSIQVAAGNPTREIQALIEEYDGLIGQTAKLYLVNVGAVEAGALMTYTGEVISTQSTEKAVSCEVGAYTLQNQRLPSNRALRDFCRFKYKSNRCGYTGAIADCDKSLDGPNGCRAHSNETRFGGFPGNPPSGAGL